MIKDGEGNVYAVQESRDAKYTIRFGATKC